MVCVCLCGIVLKVWNKLEGLLLTEQNPKARNKNSAQQSLGDQIKRHFAIVANSICLVNVQCAQLEKPVLEWGWSKCIMLDYDKQRSIAFKHHLL